MAQAVSNANRNAIARELLNEMPACIPEMLYDMTDHISMKWASGMTLDELHAEYETTESYTQGIREFVHHTWLWLEREYAARRKGAKA